MRWFPLVSITNAHKLGGFKTTQKYSLTALEVASPESVSWAKTKVSTGLLPSGGSEEGICFLALFSF